LEDQNDGASSSRNTNFKPLLLNEIQAGGDIVRPAPPPPGRARAEGEEVSEQN
jgi:hypothetical protein